MTPTPKPRPLRRRKPLSAEKLRQFLKYDPATGQFTWVGPAHPRRRPGDIVGGWGRGSGRGHRTVQIENSPYYLHRLAWLWMTGEWPEHEIDHINGNPTDNRWANLRQATHQENVFNTWRAAGASGEVGVTRRREVWCAQVGAFGGMWTGRFKTKDEAVAARKIVAQRLHGEFVRGE